MISLPKKTLKKMSGTTDKKVLSRVRELISEKVDHLAGEFSTYCEFKGISTVTEDSVTEFLKEKGVMFG